jgi:hypothetical protein
MATGIVNLEDVDRKIKEQQERLAQKPEVPDTIEVEGQFPWTTKMRDAFETEILKSEKCRSCNWMNTGQKVIIMNRVTVMREQLPVITVICRQCGSLFVPKWCRKIMLQAIEEENKVLKMRRQQTGGE